MDLAAGRTAELEFEVTPADTAAALGSGDVAVLGTPRLLAWAEAATVAAVADHLDDGQTSVGTHVSLRHRAPSVVGARITVRAELVDLDGVLLRFAIVAHDGEHEVAQGEVERAVVERDRFLGKVTRRSSNADTRPPGR
jgi:predicted thioesterase